MVVMMEDYDNIGSLLPFAVVSHLMSQTSAGQCVVVDCRSFLSFNESHVKSAVNLHCPPILKRRLHRGSATSDSLLTNCELKQRVNDAETLIFYDERTFSWTELDNDSTMNIVCKLLRRSNKHLYFIQGKVSHSLSLVR